MRYYEISAEKSLPIVIFEQVNMCLGRVSEKTSICLD